MNRQTCDQCGTVIGRPRVAEHLVFGDSGFDCAEPADFCTRSCLVRWLAEDNPDVFLAAVPYAHAARLERELRVNDDDCEAGLPAAESIERARKSLANAGDRS